MPNTADLDEIRRLLEDAMLHLRTARTLVNLASEGMPKDDRSLYTILGEYRASLDYTLWLEVARAAIGLEYAISRVLILRNPEPK